MNEAAPRTVADMIRRNARARPDAPAVVGEGRNVTYGELDRRSDRIASGLVAWGLQPGDRVAYLARNATEYWELFFGAAKAGLVIVPLNFRLAAGDCLVFDNTRILHARTAFSMTPDSPGRRLQGCYADLDGLASTLAVLRRPGNHELREES